MNKITIYYTKSKKFHTESLYYISKHAVLFQIFRSNHFHKSITKNEEEFLEYQKSEGSFIVKLIEFYE